MQALNIATAGQDNDGNIAEFAQVASSEKKPISDDRLNKAIDLIKSGKANLFKDLLDRFELTVEQKVTIENMHEKGE